MEKFWWTQTWDARGRTTQVKPYLSGASIADSRLEEMAALSKKLRSCLNELDDSIAPVELRWMYKKVPEKKRALSDAFMGHMSSIIVSERFRDILAEHDLGSSQLVELPLYELKAMDKMGRTDADYGKQDPRRWFLFHVTQFKSALLPERCEGLRVVREEPSIVFRKNYGVPAKVVIQQDIARDGPEVWRDSALSDVVFFSDTIKRKVKAAKLKTPVFPFKACVLRTA